MIVNDKLCFYKIEWVSYFVKYRKINKTVVEILILDLDISNMKLKPVWMRPINNILFLAAFLFLSLQGFGQAIIVEVWPGDANNDGVVNTKNVFTLGLYLGIEGPSRFELGVLFRWC